MVINPNVLPSGLPAELKVTLLVETLASGKVTASKPAWIKFVGVFKDDSDFQEIMEAIRAERTSDDDSKVDPSYYL